MRLLLAPVLLSLGLSSPAALEAASFLTFSARGPFEALLGSTVIDSYDAPGYQHGDVFDDPAFSFDAFSDAAMSAVVGETTYHRTSFPNFNIVTHHAINQYNTGNGSFGLGFTSTSVGTSSGVYGVGFNFLNGAGVSPDLTDPFTAYIVFGDGSATNVLLPLSLQTLFFGVTSPDLIRSIHLGLPDGELTLGGRFHLDVLTIGSPAVGAVPEPGTLLLLSGGLAAVVAGSRRRRRS